MNAPVAAPSGSITAAQVRSFVDDGYLVVPGLVSPADLERLKADIVALARGEYPCESLKPLPPGLDAQQVLEKTLCIHQPHYISPVMREFVYHKGMCSVLAQIVGAHLPHWDGSVKCMQSMLFVKPPGLPGQAWHQDELYIPTRDRSLCGAWIAIDDATVENGCLWVMPGSHRSGYLHQQRDHGNPEEFDFAGESYGFDDSREVPVVVKAGSVVFFNGYLLHRSKKNRSKIYRRALVNHYMNSWSLLPWKNEIGVEDTRNVVNVTGTDPYAWKGYEPFQNNVWLRTYKTPEEIEALKLKSGE